MIAYVTKPFPVYFHDGVEMFKVGRTIQLNDLDDLRVAEAVAHLNGGEIRLLRSL